MANLDYNDFRRCDCVWRMVLPDNSLKLLDSLTDLATPATPRAAAGGSGVDCQRPLHCRVSGFVQSCAAPNCQSSVRCRMRELGGVTITRGDLNITGPITEGPCTH